MLPLTITDRGSSWYFTGDITAVGAGISVQADGVTIDLMGFSLGGGTGVGIDGNGRAGLIVRNGIIVRQGSIVRGCRAIDNTENGIWVEGDSGEVGALVTDCIVDGNRKNGIRVDGQSTVRDNHVHSNSSPGKAGIWVLGTNNRIEGNSVISNYNGIDVDGSFNVIARNMVAGSLISNFDIDPTAMENPIIVHPIASSAPPGPWANIDSP